MSIAEGYNFAVRGHLDFERAEGQIEVALGLLNGLDVDELAMEFHYNPEDVSDIHLYDPRQEIRLRLEEARQKVRDACQMVQSVLAELP